MIARTGGTAISPQTTIEPEVEQDPTKPRRPAYKHRRRMSLRRRVLTTGAALVCLVLVLPAVSYGAALAAPGNLSTSEKSVEWLRDHHLGGVVNRVESWWFSNHQAKAGGEPDHSIDIAAPPEAGSGGTTPSTVSVATTPRPADVHVPDGVTPLANEGVWQPVGPSIGGASAMYATQVRPDSVHTSVLDGLVWIDPKLARFELHPGLQEPGGSFGAPAQVPMNERLDLLAAFNSGFRMGDANGGFWLDGHSKGKLRDGAASFAITKDGTPTIGQWGRDVQMTPDTLAVRQNLDLIVDGGQPVPGLDDNADGQWGQTLGNRVLVWRSAVCETANGGIIYGYGDGLGAQSLAELMTRAGCQRAMELDINPSWMSFNFYGASTAGDPSSVVGTKLLPEQHKSGNRYLSDDSRDFFAVLRRTP